MQIQALGPQGVVERLHVRVVGWLPRPREVDLYPVVVRPQIHDLTGELGPIVTEQELGNFSLLPNRSAGSCREIRREGGVGESSGSGD